MTRAVVMTAAGLAWVAVAGCGATGSVTGGIAVPAAAVDGSGVKADLDVDAEAGSVAGKGAGNGIAAWGRRYTWPSGLAIEVSKPVTCAPGEYSSPARPARAVKVTIRVLNGTRETFDPALLTIGDDARFDGVKAEALYDSGGDCGSDIMTSATVLPGTTFTLARSFVVGKKPGRFQLALQPDFASEKAVFVGKA